MGRSKMSGRTSNFQRVSKFGPSTNSVKTNKNTKISQPALGGHGSAEKHQTERRQTAVNYYETHGETGRRKTAVERINEQRKETWADWIKTLISWEAAVENASCYLCAIICVLIIVLLCVAVPILINGISTTKEPVCASTDEGCWSNQSNTDLNSTDEFSTVEPSTNETEITDGSE